MKPSNVLFNNCKELMRLYLKSGDKPNFPKEIKISKKLLSQFPDMGFWRQYDPQTTFTSLSVFLTKQGQNELKKEYDLYCLVRPEPNPILDDNAHVNVDSEIQGHKKILRTIQEFVDEVL